MRSDVILKAAVTITVSGPWVRKMLPALLHLADNYHMCALPVFV